MDFRTKRQLIVLIIFFSIVFIPLGLFIYFWIPEATCEDNRRNQSEEEVDCGGPCLPCVLKNPRDLDVFWVRFLSIREGAYDIVAEIRNPNIKLGAKDFEYEFQFFDTEGVLVARRGGRSFIFPSETKHLVEANIQTLRTLSRVALIIRNAQWIFTDAISPDIVVGERKLVLHPERGEAVLEATLINRSLSDFDEVIVLVLIFDELENVLAVSKTVERNVRSGEGHKLFFSWPKILPIDKTLITLEAKVNTIGK